MSKMTSKSQCCGCGSGIWCFFTPDFGIRDGEEIRDPDHHLRALETVFLGGLKYLNSLMRIQIWDLFDPGSWICDGKTDPGSVINILDPQDS
jgi:hypothetical protein